MKNSIIIKVYGRVQGVGFRYFVLQNAQLLKITGFVKNEYNNSVYIEAEAEQSQLDIFVSTIKLGNTYSIIEKFHTQNQPLQNFNKFEIRY
ncbi:MAG: acylphosphatase [Bacteroidales bacterium]|nr:acylphosphatase [Bacteroidales bacterium]